MTLSFLNLIRLRAAFWSITGNTHGTKDTTDFYITGIEESIAGVLTTVFTQHDQQHGLHTSEEELLNMVADPVLGIESTIKEAVEWFWIPRVRRSIGGKAPRVPTSLTSPPTVKEVPCWCCGMTMKICVEETQRCPKSSPDQDDSSAPTTARSSSLVLGKRKRDEEQDEQQDPEHVKRHERDNEDHQVFGSSASPSMFEICSEN